MDDSVSQNASLPDLEQKPATATTTSNNKQHRRKISTGNKTGKK